MDHLYIRHTIGGTLFADSKKYNDAFTLEEGGGVWTFTIRIEDAARAKELLAAGDELNLFLVSTEDANRKSWFYTSTADIRYNAAEQLVTIVADHRTDYPV